LTIGRATLLAVLIAASSPALIAPASAAGNPFLPGGGGGATAGQGTSKEQAACRPDVRRFCSTIKPGSDSGVFLSCLKANRAKLSKACNQVLASHGE
jgi:hypothetical protein